MPAAVGHPNWAMAGTGLGKHFLQYRKSFHRRLSRSTNLGWNRFFYHPY